MRATTTTKPLATRRIGINLSIDRVFIWCYNTYIKTNKVAEAKSTQAH